MLAGNPLQTKSVPQFWHEAIWPREHIFHACGLGELGAEAAWIAGEGWEAMWSPVTDYGLNPPPQEEEPLHWFTPYSTHIR